MEENYLNLSDEDEKMQSEDIYKEFQPLLITNFCNPDKDLIAKVYDNSEQNVKLNDNASTPHYQTMYSGNPSNQPQQQQQAPQQKLLYLYEDENQYESPYTNYSNRKS